MSQGTVSRWEKGSKPKPEQLKAIARFFGTSVDELLKVEPTTKNFEQVVVKGHLQAGVFREAIEWPQDEWYSVPVPRTEAFEGVPKTCYEVRGNSMNLLYPDGTILVCVSLIDLGRQPRDGERVICQRRTREGLYEATVKEYRLAGDGTVWLWPRSSDPAFQAPLQLSGPTDGEDSVRVTGLVIQSIRTEADR